MPLIDKPHDKYFRFTMADLDTAQFFLEEYLPYEIISRFNLNKLENVTDDYFNEKFSELFTDLVFRAPLKDGSIGHICFLFEHKSYMDYTAPLQILGYMAEIWKKTIKKKEISTSILPILFLMEKMNGVLVLH